MDPEARKFILFTLEYPPFKGGVSRYYQNLAGYWPDDNLFVLADSPGGGQDSENIIYRPLLNRYLRPRWLPAVWHLYKEISNPKYPTANIHIIIGQILPLGQATYFLSKLFKFKYSVILHGLDFSLAVKTGRRRKLTAKILAKADKIICANSYTANLVKFFAADLAAKVSVVNPGLEPLFVRNPQRVGELREKYGLAGKIVLFGLGRLVRRKGFDRVIAAMPALVQSAAPIVFVIGGTGPEEENFKKLAAALPEEARSKIIFLGALSEADRWAWLELCDIFIMAARNIDGDFEGFGLVYLEANLAGKPVIAGDSGGVRDAVINNVSGLLVDPEKPDEIAAAVSQLAADPRLRHSLGEQGQRRVVENFSAKKMAEKIFYLVN